MARGHIPDLRGDWDPWETVKETSTKRAERAGGRLPPTMYRHLPAEQRATMQRDESGNLVPTEATFNPEFSRPGASIEVEHEDGRVETVLDGKDAMDMAERLSETNMSRKRASYFMGPAEKASDVHLSERALHDAKEPAVTAANEFDEREMGRAMKDVKDRFSTVAPEAVGKPPVATDRVHDERLLRRAFRDKATMAGLGLVSAEDEEEWHPDEKRARAMPYWLFMESVREDLEYEFKAPRVTKAVRADNPLIRHSLVDAKGRAYASGGRKNAKAHVCVQLGDGNVTVNGRTLADYFPTMSDRREAVMPLMAVYATGAFDVTVRVSGGGHSGQAGAIKHGLARALARFDPYLRLPLRRLRLLQRDPRAVERKKIGRVKARKAFQWVKR